MKRIIIGGVVGFVLGLTAPQIVQAQGSVTFLSNLGQTSAGSDPIGSNAWLAANFITGNNVGGYVLNSVQLAMTDASGSPSGFTVMIYTAIIGAGVDPGSSLGTLTGSADPATGGTYTYTVPSDLSLSPSTAYFIVITAATPVASGAYAWSLANVNSYSPSGGWGVSSAAFYKSITGLSWAPTSGYFQYALNATSAPEPGAIGLFTLGGLLVGLLRWKSRAVR